HAAHHTGLRTWAFTGPTPNPLADACDKVLAVPSPDSQVVQELHLVSSHLLCEYVDQALPLVRDLPRVPAPAARTVGLADRFGRDGRALAATGGHGPNGQGPNGHGPNGHGPNGHGSARRDGAAS
ncbi:hypothetical protein ACVCAH_37730, partial [Micromonospora sp. LZ34]